MESHLYLEVLNGLNWKIVEFIELNGRLSIEPLLIATENYLRR